jgi:FkbM family methyltransferase
MSDTAPFNRLKACRYGTLLYNINDRYIGQALDLYGEYSEGEVVLFRRIVRPGDIVLDVGANLGAHTIFFSTAVGPRGAVLAFEPQRLVFQALCANMALNNVTNTVCYWTALTDAPGVMSVPVIDPRRPFNFGGVGLGEHTRGDQIAVMRADSFALPRCRLVKIDVEGMELQVLRGATGLIERHHPVVYVENDRPDRSEALVRWIHALGYRLYWHRPPLYNPDNFLNNRHNEYPGIVSQNMLCVHPEQAVDVADLSPVRIPAG